MNTRWSLALGMLVQLGCSKHAPSPPFDGGALALEAPASRTIPAAPRSTKALPVALSIHEEVILAMFSDKYLADFGPDELELKLRGFGEVRREDPSADDPRIHLRVVRAEGGTLEAHFRPRGRRTALFSELSYAFPRERAAAVEARYEALRARLTARLGEPLSAETVSAGGVAGKPSVSFGLGRSLHLSLVQSADVDGSANVGLDLCRDASGTE